MLENVKKQTKKTNTKKVLNSSKTVEKIKNVTNRAAILAVHHWSVSVATLVCGFVTKVS